LRTGENIAYFAVRGETRVDIEYLKKVPIPFKEKCRVADVKEFGFDKISFWTPDGVTLVKVHPGIDVTILSEQPYHSFEVLDTPDRYRNEQEVAEDFLYNPTKATLTPEGAENGVKHFPESLALRERGNRIIQLPGAIVYPDYCAARIPGWMAKEFNGSPEFGFAYSPFSEPRSGEVLHAHQEIMEPYIGLEGELPLFVAIKDGSETLTVNDGDAKRSYRGEIIPVRAGDVVLPLPNTPHRVQFDGAKFPFTMYCVNYAPQTLDKVSGNDRIVLEK
jgi:mannose-6-phosphate isomerase-like protein (cupin superfamily)